MIVDDLRSTRGHAKFLRDAGCDTDHIPFRVSPRRKTQFSFIDLFAGIGGVRLPFQELGGGCVFTSEWDKFAKKNLRS